MKTFLEFLQAESFSQAMVHPTFDALKKQRVDKLNKVGIHPNFAAIQKQRQDSINKVGIHPNFAEIQRRRQAAGMSEEEMNEFLGLFKKKAPASPFAKKNRVTRVGHGDQAYRTDHSYSVGSDIEPSTVPVFKPSWRTKTA